jgi:hypothetical protein
MPIVGSFAGASARAYGLGAGGVQIGDFESIQTITLTTTTASIEFISIPATYTHLQIRGLLRTSTANTNFDNALMQLNSDTASNYSWHLIQGTGASAGSGAGSSQTSMRCGEIPRNNVTASVFGVVVIDILDYANTNKYKTIRTINGVDANGSGAARLDSGNWRNTAAISSIKIFPDANSFVQYSSLALYGVKA